MYVLDVVNDLGAIFFSLNFLRNPLAIVRCDARVNVSQPRILAALACATILLSVRTSAERVAW